MVIPVQFTQPKTNFSGMPSSRPQREFTCRELFLFLLNAAKEAVSVTYRYSAAHLHDSGAPPPPPEERRRQRRRRCRDGVAPLTALAVAETETEMHSGLSVSPSVRPSVRHSGCLRVECEAYAMPNSTRLLFLSRRKESVRKSARDFVTGTGNVRPVPCRTCHALVNGD